METKIYSKHVCGLLAQQLVTEQAEVVKHQAVVESIWKTIVEKKTDIIKRIVNGNFFRIDGIRYLALKLSIEENGDMLVVDITFGITPDVIGSEEKLTRREAELLKEYRDNFDKTIFGNIGEYGGKAVHAARELKYLKNQIYLLRIKSFNIDMTKAFEPKFFEESGLLIRDCRGARNLEDYIA